MESETIDYGETTHQTESRARAESSSAELPLARSSSSASTYSASDPSCRDRLGSKTSVASSSAGNRSSIISNEAAPGPDEVLEIPFHHERKSKGKLVPPIMEEGEPSFSRQVPELFSPQKMRDDVDFLKDITCCQCEEMLIKNMCQIMSRSGGRPIYSHPFIAKHHGCKLCLRVALDQESISIGVQLMKGDKDKQFVWPFSMIVILQLKNESGRNHRVKMFRCEKNRSLLKDCLSRPKNDMNMAMGYPHFIARQHLLKEGYIKNDTMLLNCFLFPKDAKINLQSECPTTIK